MGDGGCEFVEAFAKPYPTRMIAGVMGSPLEDAPRLGRWANLIQGQFDPVKIATMLPALEGASTEFVAYVDDLIRERKGDSKDDLITKLIEAEEDGDRLTEEEMGHLVSAVLVGGVDTTQAQLAHGIRLFAAHPGQWSLLAQNPAELAPAAAEEVLRGPHFCLGANLARAELEEAFAFLAPRMRDLELAGEPVYARRSACIACTSCRSRSVAR